MLYDLPVPSVTKLLHVFLKQVGEEDLTGGKESGKLGAEHRPVNVEHI
jgi:hypothetical protein